MLQFFSGGAVFAYSHCACLCDSNAAVSQQKTLAPAAAACLGRFLRDWHCDPFDPRGLHKHEI